MVRRYYEWWLILSVNHAPYALEDDTGINVALLAALPAARNVLELGCATGRLARRYKGANPGAAWTGVDVNADALEIARPFLDRVLQLDLDVDPIAQTGSSFDLIVVGDVLEHLKQPETLLRELQSICTADARLVCCIPNMSHISVIERLVRGDIMYDAVGLLDTTHLRFLAPRSAFKMFLDAGWLPNLVGGYQGGHPNPRFAQAIIESAEALGIPQKSAEHNVYSYQLVIDCTQRRPATKGPAARRISVIVPGVSDAVLDLNVLRSPGLHEIGAEFIVCRDVNSAADGWAAGARQTTADWLLYCHEDVYFPRGSGFELLEVLDRIAPADAATTVLGFAGVGIDEALHPFRAGLIVDRRTLRDFPATDRAISIADFAVLAHRDNPIAVDPAFGFHLWATDLCLQTIYGSAACFPTIVRIPVLHNCVEDDTFPAAYAASAQRLASKYPQLATIPTLRAEISPNGSFRAPSFARPVV